MKKKSNKYIIIAVSIFICCVIVFIFFNIINSTNWKDYDGPIDDKYFDNPEKIDEELNKNYKIKDYVMPNGDILIELKNNNKYGVTADIYLDLMDTNENVIASGTGWGMINPNNKFYYKFYTDGLFPDEAGVKKEYDHYKVRVELHYAVGTKFYNNCITSKKVKTKDYRMIITLKNNCNETIEAISAGVLFYDSNKKIIGFANGYIDKIKKHGKAKMDVFIPDNGDGYENINYSSYKVVIMGSNNF